MLRRLGFTYTLDGTVTTKLNLVDYPEYQSDPEALYSSLKSTMNDSFTNATFITSFVSTLTTLNSSAFSSVDYEGLAIAELVVQYPPSAAPTEAPHFRSVKVKLTSGALIAIIVAGSIILLALLAVLVVIICRNSNKRQTEVRPTTIM